MIKKSMFFGAALLAALPITSNASTLNYSNKVQGTGVAYIVIDGDTLIVNADDKKNYNKLKSYSRAPDQLRYFDDRFKSFRIRLAAVDTQESVHKDKSKNSQQGKEASIYLKNKIEKKRIGYTCWDHGKYGRLICSVSYKGKDIGLDLIENGYSKYISYWGKHPYLDKEYRTADQLLK